MKVHVTSGDGMDIIWSDGHPSHYDFPYLRDLCPCATCDDERRKKADLAAVSGSRSAAVALPMYKPKAKARAARAVGQYAIQIDFTDGHTTGIYSFDYLRTICPCEACEREFRAAPNQPAPRAGKQD